MAFAEFSAGDDFGLKFVVVIFVQSPVLSEYEMLADGDFAAGADQAFPFVGIGAELAREQHFNASVQKPSRRGSMRADRLRIEAGAAAIQAGREDAGVVEDDEIVGA